MKSLLPLTCCIVAGHAGWWAMSLGEEKAPPAAGAASAPTAAAVPVDPARAVKEAVQKLRQGRPGSAEIPRLAAAVSAVPDDSLQDLKSALWELPLSTGREFALTLIAQRLAAAQGTAAAAPPEDAVPPANVFRDLEEEMAELATDPGPEPGFGRYRFDTSELSDWVSADPATATAAILKLPPGTGRAEAVDTAAGAMALTDPAGALEFVLRSGEPRPGPGAAQAWAKVITGAAPAGGTVAPPAPEEFLRRMTRGQQNCLFGALADVINDVDDSNLNPRDPSGGSDVTAIARLVLQAKEPGPGLESFFYSVADGNPRAAEAVFRLLRNSVDTPATRAAMEVLCTTRAEELIAAGMSPGRASDFAAGSWMDNPPDTSPDTVLNRAAPVSAEHLTSHGRLPEALEMLDSLTDPDARTATLKTILPAWMDADPAAARAAFNAAPLTALERERLESQPSFLMHPAEGSGR